MNLGPHQVKTREENRVFVEPTPMERKLSVLPSNGDVRTEIGKTKEEPVTSGLHKQSGSTNFKSRVYREV